MKLPLIHFAMAAALAAGTAFAQAPAAPQQGGRGGRGPLPAMRQGAVPLAQRMIRNLNLTDPQRAQARGIFQQANQNAKATREQLRQNRQQMQDAVMNNDTALIQSLASQQGALQGQLIAIQSEAMAQFFSILTPDQKAKAQQMQQRTRQLMQRRQGRSNG